MVAPWPSDTAPPTQVRHPNRATWRTIGQAAAGMLFLLPLLAHELGIEAVPWVAGALVVIGGVTRWLMIPSVNAWFTEHGLGPTPKG